MRVAHGLLAAVRHGDNRLATQRDRVISAVEASRVSAIAVYGVVQSSLH